jgi:hypothetical protein
MKPLLREPLLHFVVIASVLVGAQRLYQKHSRPVVAVTPEWLETLARDHELRSGRKPDAAQRVKLAHGFLEDEILYREALKLGNVADPRVRQALITTLREALEPVVADPPDSELEKLRQESPERYSFPAQVSFEHASFATAADLPAGLLESLRGGASPPPAPAMRLPNPLPMTWLPQLERMFGAEFARAVVAAKPGEWTGPLTSSRGVHLVKVLQLSPARAMPLAEVRPALVTQWIAARQQAVVAEKVAALRRGYRVVLPPEIPPP